MNVTEFICCHPREEIECCLLNVFFFFFLQVSDRQSYLVVSLVLCLSLGFLLCLQCCRSSSPSPSTTAVAALPKSNHYPSPKRFVRLAFSNLS